MRKTRYPISLRGKGSRPLLTLLAGVGLLCLPLLGDALLRARLIIPLPSLHLQDRHGAYLTVIASPENGELGYWEPGSVPPRVRKALLAAEDGRFDRHPGVDPAAAARAAWQDLRARRIVSGASTIAMQVARMQGTGERTWLRKTREALTALILEGRNGREAVLEQYLRIAPFGNRVHGLACAAREYFDKPPADLTWAEAAFLAALPQAPGRMNPRTLDGFRKAARRGTFILERLATQGALTAEEYASARKALWHLNIQPARQRPAEALHALLHFEETTFQNKVHRQGPALTTTLDLDLQRHLQKEALKAVRDLESRGVTNVALIVVELPTMAVRAWVGSTGYFDNRRAGALDYGRIPRSPGSTLKPFIYALGLENRKISPATVLDDLRRGAGGIGNADEVFLGPLLPRFALANSRNVPVTDLLARMGLDSGYRFLGNLGLHDGRAPAGYYGLGLTIGSLPVTLEHLVRAYGALANGGVLCDLQWIEGGCSGAQTRVLSEETARRITLFLSDPMARLPVFGRMGPSEYPFPVAVKTGTSSNYRDAWAVAYSSRYLVGVWMGDPDERPMDHVSGFTSSAKLAKQALLLLHGEHGPWLDAGPFPEPGGMVKTRLCRVTGRRPGKFCDPVFDEWLRPEEVPGKVCTAHKRLAIDTRNGVLASSATPERFREVRTFCELPPEYAGWAVQMGLTPPPKEIAGEASALPTTQDTPTLALSLRERGPGATATTVNILSPQDGLHLLQDPETPGTLATLSLEAAVEPRSEQVVWYVDGLPFETSVYPFAARWKLQPGAHIFQARLASSLALSRVVTVYVQ